MEFLEAPDGRLPALPRPCCQDEYVLLTAARAVLMVFQKPLEEQNLSVPSVAALRLLETALEPYNHE
ncbi:hypothetical protein IC614_03235 [Allosphingosinicella flava]|uniref:Uncharacterized protein n=1 Tax=Allosphingosinicella flava TaxID=2771430 RepID=A0A7T2LMY3_9SPHN|nr:hypothetical protein [Sphingosinicella flava]QPQ55627.1 hypothetical protein IC614_03235 [Sphingosinicella flava]